MTLLPENWKLEPLGPKLWKVWAGRRLQAVVKLVGRSMYVTYGEIGELVFPILQKHLNDNLVAA